MKTLIVQEPLQVSRRLSELALTPQGVQEIIDTMVSARRNWTPNDVSGAGGTRAYLDGTCRARDIGGPLGWVKDAAGNLESMVNTELSLRFVVCNANEHAGVVSCEASNRNPKGPATENVVAANSEQATFESLLEDAKSIAPLLAMRPDGVTTWYLFVFADDQTYRAELSCPINVEGGFLSDCRERIILVRDGDNDNNLRPRVTLPDSDPVFEINVTRKSA